MAATWRPTLPDFAAFDETRHYTGILAFLVGAVMLQGQYKRGGKDRCLSSKQELMDDPKPRDFISLLAMRNTRKPR